jgi:hypothetical protein
MAAVAGEGKRASQHGGTAPGEGPAFEELAKIRAGERFHDTEVVGNRSIAMGMSPLQADAE